MKTPCVAACKNNGGICSGCYRTMNEIVGWKDLDESERQDIMNRLGEASSTHTCPQCDKPAQCDISAGKETCWCFELEKRDTSQVAQTGTCMCRHCLSKLPIL
ncbi:DUF1289 domain-containing protein [Vibrio sp. T187]|uniref:DUF1289 domain-containing protein n=1 Tax=Vibrio TaxID=662 RepID=UPI0010CA0BFE|nr:MULTISPECIES: DUF1289 domain-containing protein [Vibrio]MBW3695981.1 DUF1289 domain-containing protein [Vibrio sp. T187]